ncbi:hypothetical protein [Streptomyces sp. NPDC001914]|uniref:hypothetical protein n=1 Tax=Streptomyces sp. NPDC001914 TaxID=3364623 RepID=UPI0036B8FAA9
MSHRPYPRRGRALAQVERGRVPEPPLCPICQHPVPRHATEEGHPVCTRGQGPISCRDCAELWARMPMVAAMANFGIAFHHGAEPHRLVVEQPRRAGKSAVVRAIVDRALKTGEVIHVATRHGLRCIGGAEHACTLPPFCPEQPVVLARVERTVSSHPSQWNAWTPEGQYLYLRYRHGIGTVDAHDSEDSSTWTYSPERRLAAFDTGQTYDGEISLADFCERAGLQLADGAEVVGE